MWFFDKKNAVIVSVYCGLMVLSSTYFLLGYAADATGDESRAYVVYAVSAVLTAMMWFIGALVLWRTKRPKTEAFMMFLAVFGAVILVGRLDFFGDRLEGAAASVHLWTLLMLVCGLILVVSSYLLARKKFVYVWRIRPFLVGVMSIIITARVLMFPLVEFTIADYIDGVSLILVLAFTILSLFDEDISDALKEIDRSAAENPVQSIFKVVEEVTDGTMIEAAIEHIPVIGRK